MKAQTLIAAVTLILLGVFAIPGAEAQVTRESLDAVGARLQAAGSFYNRLSPPQRKMLSGSALNFFHVVNDWPDLENQALEIEQALSSSELPISSDSSQPNENIATTLAPVRVSNPTTDFKFGPAGGFTESETSTAWCGTHVVVGFNDSGSFWESGFASSFSNLSFNGFSLSTTTGTTYTDKGFLPASVTGNFLLGDPVLACTTASNFYYSSLLESRSATGGPLTDVSVSFSTNGGSSFGAPVIAVAKNGLTHFLDKDWMAVNPANPRQIVVTYTDFDSSGTLCGSGKLRVAIELVFSKNGGSTWSSPTVIDQQCNVSPNFPFDQGSQVTFSPSGAVNVAFELFSGALPGPQILFRQAPSLGTAFGPKVLVTGLLQVGDGFELQGGFRASIDLQGLVVDRSGLPTNGTIYTVWHGSDTGDSRHVFNGVLYSYSDIWISKSTNNGSSWSAPVQVNTNAEPLSNGLGTDSFMPGVAVDNTSGKVAVCWYDRRNDPLNYKVDRFCGDSTDAGATFTNFRVTPTNFMPIHGADDLVNPVYMGDYDTVASDGLKVTNGFVGAFQRISAEGGAVLAPNSDVWAFNFN